MDNHYRSRTLRINRFDRQMNQKELNNHFNPLSEKIINNGKISFKLWLEFEETTPWNDLENDFANISVDTLDGRRYGINIWTIKFLDTLKKENEKVEKVNYIIPPDLFVKELTRDCIEETIKDLLKQGNLEELLNNSIFGLNFINPFWDVDNMEEESAQAIINELQLELSDHHILSNRSVKLIARNAQNDDIILELEDDNIAIVHLTWTSKKEKEGFPITRIYSNEIEFWEKEMKNKILENKNQQ